MTDNRQDKMREAQEYQEAWNAKPWYRKAAVLITGVIGSAVLWILGLALLFAILWVGIRITEAFLP